MSLDSINRAIETAGGKWVNLRRTTDAKLVGTIVDVDERVKTFEGAVVLSRKSGEPRKEWVFTLQTDRSEEADDDGIRKFSANESAQRAITQAVKDAGKPLAEGGRIAIVVSKDPANDREQAEYKAKYEPGAPPAPPANAQSVDDLL